MTISESSGARSPGGVVDEVDTPPPPPPPRCGRAWWFKFLKENALIFTTLLGIAIGFGIGVALQDAGASEEVLQWVGLPGEIFLRALRATIVPIVVCMVITATATVDARSNGRIAIIAVTVFYVTSVIAVLTATVLFFLLRPDANSLSIDASERFGTRLETQDIFLDLIRNIFPSNVIGATISQSVTVYTPNDREAGSNATITYTKSLGSTSGVNILGLITVCAAVGAAANRKLARDSAFLSFFVQGQEVVLVIMHWLAWTTPFGVCSLVAESIAGVENLSTVFIAIGRLVVIVVVGELFHQLITLPALLFLITRRNVIDFMVKCARPFFVAFAATSTSVALPHMLDACRLNKIHEGVTKFVIPMCVTLHADGSALYMAAASLFVTQTSSEENIDAPSVLIICALASVLSMAIPPVPSSSIVNIVIILTSLDVPLQGIALLFTVEWLLDRLRSGVNAGSHVICAAAIDRLCNGKDAGSHETSDSSSSAETNCYDNEIEIEPEQKSLHDIDILPVLDGQEKPQYESVKL